MMLGPHTDLILGDATGGGASRHGESRASHVALTIGTHVTPGSPWQQNMLDEGTKKKIGALDMIIP